MCEDSWRGSPQESETCMCEDGPADVGALLSSLVRRFGSMFPESSVRFAGIVGKRLSHIAGDTGGLYFDERRVPINDRIVMFVHDGNGIDPEALAGFGAQVAATLDDLRDRSIGRTKEQPQQTANTGVPIGPGTVAHGPARSDGIGEGTPDSTPPGDPIGTQESSRWVALVLDRPREETIRLVIADDHPLIREGLRRTLAGSGLEIEGDAGSGSEAVELVDELQPDLVLLDVRMPGMDGLAALREIKRRHPHIPVVMLTAYDEPAWLVQAIAYGAAGYLMKTMAREDLVSAIKSVVSGDGLIDPARLSSLVRELGSETVEPTTPLLADVNALTEREREVLALIAEGLTNQQIAKVLYVAPSTIKSHVQNVMLKLGASDRTQAAVMAVRAKITRDEPT